MKKCSLFLGFMMVSTIMFAQHKADPMDRAVNRADNMKKELSLDEVQYKAVKAINEDFAVKQMKVWNDSSLSKEIRHKKMRTLHKEKDAAISKVLTEDQKAKWASHRSKHSAKRKAGLVKYEAEHAKRMQKDLSLSDEQTSKIKALDQEFGTKLRALRSDSTLAREDAREHAKQLRQEYRSKTKTVLTEDQFKTWELQKAERKRKKF